MARRITRAESVGLPAPSVENLREAFATFTEMLIGSDVQLEQLVVSGQGLNPDEENPSDAISEWARSTFGSEDLANRLASAFIVARVNEDMAALNALEDEMRALLRERGDNSEVTPITGLLALGQFRTFSEVLRESTYAEDAVRQVGIDLAWAATLEGDDITAPGIQGIFLSRLAYYVERREAALTGGWRYAHEPALVAERELFWQAAEAELMTWLDDATHLRERKNRRGIWSRIGRS